MSKFVKPSFSQEQNTEYHRQQCAIVYEYIKYRKNHLIEETSSERFAYSPDELIHALYDVLFAANKQINYREYIYHRYNKNKAGQAEPSDSDMSVPVIGLAKKRRQRIPKEYMNEKVVGKLVEQTNSWLDRFMGRNKQPNG